MRHSDQEIVAIMDAAGAAGVGTGWNGVKLTFVDSEGLLAVLAPPMLKPDLLTRLTGRTTRVVATMVERQRLLEHLLDVNDVLPVRPGLKIGYDAAADFLSANAASLRVALGDIARQVQYQLTVSWDPAAALQRFAADTGSSSRDARDVATAAERVRNQLSAEFAQHLDQAVLDRIDQPIDGIETLLNTVLLVSRDRTEELDHALERIDSVWSQGLRLRLLGPLPPLNFSLVVAMKVGPAERRAALAALGLGHDAAMPDIDRAFRSSARAIHPDQGGTGADMAALVAARDILKRLVALDAEFGARKVHVLAQIRRDGEGDPNGTSSADVVEQTGAV